MGKKQIIAIVLVLALVGGYFGFGMYKQYKIEETPVKHIAYALSQQELSKTMEGSITFDLNEESDILTSELAPGTITYFSELLGNTRLDLNATVDINEENIDDSKFKYNVGLNYSDSNIVTGDLFYENYLFGMSSEELFTKGIYFDLNEEIGEFDFNEINLHEFYSIIVEEDQLMQNFVTGYEDYLNVYGELLNDRFIKKSESLELKQETIKGDLYELELSYTDQIHLMNGLLEVMEEDEDLKLLVKDRALKILDLVESDYSHLIDASQEEITSEFAEVRKGLNTRFDELWVEAFTELNKESLNTMQQLDMNSELTGAFSQTINIFISNDNRLRNVKLVIETPVGSLTEDFTTYDYIPYDVDIESFVNVNDLDETHENEIAMNGLSNVLNSEGLRKFREDSNRLNVNEETEMINSYLQMLDMLQ